MLVKRLSQAAIVIFPLVVIASMDFVGAVPALQGAVTCEWVALDSGEARSHHTLATVFGAGVVAFGGVERTSRDAEIKDDVHLLDLSGSAAGTWSELSPSGASVRDRADHMSASRDGDGTTTMYTYGGVDEIAGGGGTFTWSSPVTAGGIPYHGMRGAFAPRDVVRTGYALEIGESSATWSALSADGSGPLADASAVWLDELDSFVMFGGRTGEEANTATNAISSIHIGTDEWSSASLPGSPTARFAHSAVYDTAGQRMIVFGGTRNWNNGLNDTWALDLSDGLAGATWVELDPIGSPPGVRYDHAAVYVPDLNWMVVFGGTRNGTGRLDDVFALDLNTEFTTWQELDPSGSRSPAGVTMVTGAWSDAAGMAIFYGGDSAGSSKREAWGLRCSSPATPTSEFTDTPAPSDTPAPTGTLEPTITPEMSETPASTGSPTPSDTPTAIDTPVASPTPERIVIHLPRVVKNNR